MKKKIKVWLPVYATAEFECEIETDDIEDKDKVVDSILKTYNRTGYLCHHCSRSIETDYTVDDMVFESGDEKQYLYEDVKEMIIE